MTNRGDDCFFYYYSTCSKGDNCPFRHCEAAMGNETVCNLWMEGRCYRTVCSFRHMEITKNRKEIPCYWENQASGCQKPHCAFLHEKPRIIDGMFVPPNKNVSKNEEQLQEEPAPQPVAPLPTAACNPQLRGVIKTEAQEPAPSPTHPPVVINPADDDEDEDDQFSEEGEEGKVGTLRKIPKSEDSLNFGVSTLEEIRLRKTLKASIKRAGYPIQSSDAPANREKENISVSFRHSQIREKHEDTLRPRVGVASRLGRKIPSTGVISAEIVPLRKSLAEFSGGVVDEEPSQKARKPIRERLGLFTGTDYPQPESPKAPEQIRIKTLEEIKQEKAAKSQSKDGSSAAASEVSNTGTSKGVRRTITTRESTISQVRTSTEVLPAKRRRGEEPKEESPTPNKAETTVEKAPGKNQTQPAAPGRSPLGGVRVKTLDEIRREKAARVQAQTVQEADSQKSSETQENGAKKPRLQRFQKVSPQTGNVTTEKSADASETLAKSAAVAPEITVANGNKGKVLVKTFEEIMREKQLRKEMEVQAKVSSKAEPSQKQDTEESTNRKVPAKIRPTLLASSRPSSTTATPDSTLSTRKVPVRKLISLKSKVASPLNNQTASGSSDAAVPSISEKQPETESCSRSPSSSNSAEKNKNLTSLVPVQQDQSAPQADDALNNQKTDAKVRPKLNVKPSVVKPAAKVKPGQKRKGLERSAVAAVKPLNSTSSVLEQPSQETPCTDRQVPPTATSEAQLSSAFAPSTRPVKEELQTVPTFKQSVGQFTKPTVSVTAAREACTVPQGPVLKNQPKSRRISVAASRAAPNDAASTSAMDELDDLILEFGDDQLGDQEMDPAIGEDDLLQELSEMIDG